MTSLYHDPEQWHRHIEALINASPDFIAIAGVDRLVYFVNEQGRALVGIPKEIDVTKTSMIDFLTVEGLHQSLEIEQPAVLRDGVWRGRATLKDWRTGEPIAVEKTVIALRDPVGEPIGLATIQRDVRNRIAREAILAELSSQRTHSERLESLGRLSGGVAHDFNNLLTVIGNYADMIDRRHGDERTRHDAAQIKSAVIQATALTRQLLAFARADDAVYENVNLDQAVASVVTLLGSGLHARYQLEPDFTCGANVLANANRISQIVMNLILNARDAMPDGGRIEVRTELTRQGDDLMAAIVVRDFGCGMDDATLAHVYEPFFTTKERGQGTGLGLATVYGIVSEHHGTIHIESRPDEGTTVTVCLPTSRDSPLEPVTSPNESLRRRPRRGRILIVDDDPTLRGGLAGRLRALGVDVVSAAGADEALGLLLRDGRSVNLVISDLSMPGVTGDELAEMLRQHVDVPVVLMSTRRLEGSLAGIDVFTKPLGDDVLAGLIERYIPG